MQQHGSAIEWLKGLQAFQPLTIVMHVHLQLDLVRLARSRCLALGDPLISALLLA